MRWVGAVLACLLLAGCGTSPEPTHRGPITVDVVEVITLTAAGGRPSPGAIAWEDSVARKQWLGQFDDPVDVDRRVAEVVDDVEVSAGEATYVAVVATGCEIPVEVRATSTDSGLVLTPVMPTTPPTECFAATTSIAVVVAPAQDFGS